MGGGSEVLIVAYGFKPEQGSKAQGLGYEEERSPTLNTSSSCGGGGVLISYQETTGCLNPGGHPGSYNGQDAYSDMLVVEDGTCNGNRPSKRGNHEGGGAQH